MVAWQACIDHQALNVEHVEVRTTHFGFGFSPDVYKIIAQRLAVARPKLVRRLILVGTAIVSYVILFVSQTHVTSDEARFSVFALRTSERLRELDPRIHVVTSATAFEGKTARGNLGWWWLRVRGRHGP
jgi:pimeloyl-ACP methyl ester carboxylesterase